MNLLDVVPTQPKLAATVSHEELQKQVMLEQSTEAFGKFMAGIRGNLTNEEKSEIIKTSYVLSKMANRETQIFNHRSFGKTFSLPEGAGKKYFDLDKNSTDSMISVVDNQNSPLFKLADSPQTNLADLVEISKKAEMMVTPFAYLDKRSYADEPADIKANILAFDSAARSVGMSVFTINPVRHYSAIEHLRAENPNLPIMGNSFQGQFDSLAMIMPLMISLSDRLDKAEATIDALVRKVGNMDKQVQGLAQSLKAMETRLAQVESELKVQQRRRLEQQIEAERLRELDRLYAQRRSEYDWYMAYEPLMFAVKSGTQLNDGTARAIIGPCWGPDFDDIVGAALGLKQIEGQRRVLQPQLEKLWG